jgi:hypothetical protein
MSEAFELLALCYVMSKLKHYPTLDRNKPDPLIDLRKGVKEGK